MVTGICFYIERPFICELECPTNSEQIIKIAPQSYLKIYEASSIVLNIHSLVDIQNHLENQFYL